MSYEPFNKFNSLVRFTSVRSYVDLKGTVAAETLLAVLAPVLEILILGSATRGRRRHSTDEGRLVWRWKHFKWSNRNI